VGTDQLRRAGMNVDLQEMDLGSVLRRKVNQASPDKGGWNAFFGRAQSRASRPVRCSVEPEAQMANDYTYPQLKGRA
jgi:hypothetical protein